MYTANFLSQIKLSYLSTKKSKLGTPVKELSLMSLYVKFLDLRSLARTITLSSSKCTKPHFGLTD